MPRNDHEGFLLMIHQLALRAHSDLRKASDFVITTEPLGVVLTKQVNDFLLRVMKNDPHSYAVP